MLQNINFNANAGQDFFAAGVVCAIIILVAIILLFIVHRASTPKRKSAKGDEAARLKAYKRAYEMQNPKQAVKGNSSGSNGHAAVKTTPVARQTMAAAARVEKANGENTLPVERTAVITEKKEAAVKQEMPNLNTKKEVPPQPFTPASAVQARDDASATVATRITAETAPSKTAVSQASQPQPTTPPAAAASPEMPPAEIEKAAEPEKKDPNDAFNLFTDVAVAQSETSKFAAKLQDVDISRLNQEAQNLFSAFKCKNNQ